MPMSTSSSTQGEISKPDLSYHLRGKRAAVILYSIYLIDPRVRRAAEALQEEGMEVDVLCITENRDEPAHEKACGVDIFRVPMTFERGSKLIYIWQYARFFAASFWFLTKRGFRKKYDLVHVHNMPDVLVFSAIVAKLRGAKLVLDLHDPMPELMMNIYGLQSSSWPVRLLRFLEKCSIAFSDRAFTPNVTFKNLFVSRSCRSGKMEIIMNSPLEHVFDPSLTVSREPRGTQFRIMHHGSILHRHGVDVLVEAVARLRTKISGIRLDIYGLHTPFADSVMELVSKLELQDVVHYHGPKSQAEIVQAIQNTDLGVVPNRRSAFTELNFPTRIFEYLAMGRPVVVPATLGIKDYFGADQILMFEPGDVDDLAAKILWAWQNPAIVGELVERGVEIYRANLWSGEKSRFLKTINELIGEDHSRGNQSTP